MKHKPHHFFGACLLSLMRRAVKSKKRLLCLVCALALLTSAVPSVVSAKAASSGETAMCEQSFALCPDESDSDKTVTLNGIMPRDASPAVTDVTGDFADADSIRSPAGNAPEEKSASVLAAYHIAIADGENEYQPSEENPIRVEISHPAISADANTELWHIADDGTREQIIDFTVEDGRLCFYATGFSVYAIVDAPEPYVLPDIENVSSADALDSSRAEAGFYLYYIPKNSKNKTYFTNGVNRNNCLIENTSISSAALFRFEPDGEFYKLCTYVGGVKMYLHNKGGNNIELRANTADSFDISAAHTENTFFLKKSNENLWLQHSGSGGGVRFWNANTDVNNARIYMVYGDTVNPPDDMYHMDGLTYGLMNYPGGTLGYGLMADTEQNAVDMISLVVRTENAGRTLHVAENCDITLWTFHAVSQNLYTLSAEVNGVTQYLRLSGDSLSLTDDAQQATPLAMEPGTGVNSNKIRLSANGKCITMGNNNFGVGTIAQNDSAQWLHLTELSGISDEDYVTYNAEKAGVSAVPDGTHVLVYTRVWDDVNKQYDFYAIDHDGSLHPCYERGDEIMWVGSRIDTLLWNLIEYHYDDGSPNYYYELYNPYSQKYIAPQIADGQALSDTKIGINLPGRRAGEYYTDIIAWDDPHYLYAGLKADIEANTIVSCPRSHAMTFYFATIFDPVSKLTTVDTIDNNEYGITMKMVDFPVQSYKEGGIHVQNDFLGTPSGSSLSATKGLLSTDLNENGYPTAVRTGRPLSELYDGEKGLYNGAAEVNHLFIESTYKASGYFEFDSCQNFATLAGGNGTDFIVYKELGTSDRESKTTLSHGQFFPYDTISAGVYSTANPENMYSALAVPGEPEEGLLPETDPRKYEKLHAVPGTPNYYNGMEMEAGFVQTPNGKDAWGHDIIFEFKSDDDFWLYVNGELIIDLGGIHSALGGNVNFSTGDVIVDGEATKLDALFASNFRSRNPNATEADVDEYLARFFDKTDGVFEHVFKDYSPHHMKIFYMERGAGASNLHMRFNLSYVTPGHVMLTKEVSGTDDIDFNHVEYPFQIWYRDQEHGDDHLLTNSDQLVRVTYQNSTKKVEYAPVYTPPNSTQPYQSVYFLHPGLSADIHFPVNTIEYRIIECGINSEVYDHVYVNEEEITGVSIGNTDRHYYDSGWMRVADRPSVVFDNHVDPDALRTLSFQKRLYDESGNLLTAAQDPTTFSFRLSLSNGIGDELVLANMVSYYVTDPDGRYCRWDAEQGRFVATGYTDPDALNAEQREQITFETSMNGSISKIPAGYIVEVPNLPVGTKFRVVERENEIPPGYQWISYERESATYRAEDGDTLNSGWIRPNESPRMYINNRRGWGLTVNKVWSDVSAVAAHGDIYTAVYIGSTLVPGTIRQIRHPATSVRYFFDALQPGATLADYTVCEVELVNPTVDESGTVTQYYSLRRLNDGDTTVIFTTPQSAETPSPYSYTVNYDAGTPGSTPQSADEPENVRTDTVTNTRSGGVVITLYDMQTGEPLANGTFTLTKDGESLGTFTSDQDGRVTVLYDFVRGEPYTLTETRPPSGYIGLPNPAVFSVNEDDSVTIDGNEPQWEKGYPSPTPGDLMLAYIDVFNKPFSLWAVKIDSVTKAPLGDAHFALYRSVSGIGGAVEDVRPIPGYEDLVSDTSGIIPRIDNTLPAGTYYLTELTPPSGYSAGESSVVFTVSPTGEVTMVNAAQNGLLAATETNAAKAFVISVPNRKNDVELTVTKDVQGAFGDRTKEFTFTLTVNHAESAEPIAWTKNGVEQTDVLRSGGTFTLRHDDSVTIKVPSGVTITLTEANEDYVAAFRFNDAPAVTTNTMTFTLTDNAALAVTNTLDGIIPAGVGMIPIVPTALIAVAAFAGVLAVAVVRKKKAMLSSSR